MSLCKVKRTKKNKETYLETDYMYNDDNVGINLNTLLNTKTNRSMDINCLPISYSDNAFISSGSGKINITSNIGLDNKDNLQFVFNITYPNRTDLQYIEVSDEEFASDMIQTCIIDKKNIKDIACYKKAFTSMVEQIKNNALEEDVLIKTNEINSKCFIYTEDLILLGTANRLLENSASKYILGEENTTVKKNVIVGQNKLGNKKYNLIERPDVKDKILALQRHPDYTNIPEGVKNILNNILKYNSASEEQIRSVENTYNRYFRGR